MSAQNDLEYYRQRAAIEASRAKLATNPLVAAVHRNLLERYLAIIRESEGRMSPSIAA
jgi:hypothetical protein